MVHQDHEIHLVEGYLILIRYQLGALVQILIHFQWELGLILIHFQWGLGLILSQLGVMVLSLPSPWIHMHILMLLSLLRHFQNQILFQLVLVPQLVMQHRHN